MKAAINACFEFLLSYRRPSHEVTTWKSTWCPTLPPVTSSLESTTMYQHLWRIERHRRHFFQAFHDVWYARRSFYFAYGWSLKSCECVPFWFFPSKVQTVWKIQTTFFKITIPNLAILKISGRPFLYFEVFRLIDYMCSDYTVEVTMTSLCSESI